MGWDRERCQRTFGLTIRARDVVLTHRMPPWSKGTWSLVPDATAADGSRVWNPNRAREIEPLANRRTTRDSVSGGSGRRLSPVAAAGRPEQARERRVMVQFSGSVDQAGTPGIVSARPRRTDVNLADCNSCHPSGWGWQDNGFSAHVMGANIYFEQSGAQTSSACR